MTTVLANARLDARRSLTDPPGTRVISGGDSTETLLQPAGIERLPRFETSGPR